MHVAPPRKTFFSAGGAVAVIHRGLTSPFVLMAALACAASRDPGVASRQAPLGHAERAFDDSLYDLVIIGGRVMDPATGLDAVRNIAISGGTIRAVTSEAVRGGDTIDARGLVVAPGFIDLHAHAQTAAAYALQARDGVTTALELEVGTADPDAWYEGRKGGQVINYGVSAGHLPVRMAVMGDSALFPKGDAARREATPEEIHAIARGLRRGLDQGAVAVGFVLEHTEAASQSEVLEMFRTAVDYRAAAHVHLRSASRGEESMAGLTEVIAATRMTGVPVHLLHVQVSGPYTDRLLDAVADARALGLDVTAECFPYTAWMARIEAPFFDDWRVWEVPHFSRFEWMATGERLDRESFARYREIGGNVLVHISTEQESRTALANPLTMIASDNYMEETWGSRIGTYARILGRYVREERVLTLMDAIRKMTIMPARRLEARVPSMAQKGRVQAGADADLTVFSPERVRERATFEHLLLPSEGIEYVLVNGVPVVAHGEAVADVRPGQAVRAPIRGSSCEPSKRGDRR